MQHIQMHTGTDWPYNEMRVFPWGLPFLRAFAARKIHFQVFSTVKSEVKSSFLSNSQVILKALSKFCINFKTKQIYTALSHFLENHSCYLNSTMYIMSNMNTHVSLRNVYFYVQQFSNNNNIF
jgi:hypothetical protein